MSILDAINDVLSGGIENDIRNTEYRLLIVKDEEMRVALIARLESLRAELVQSRFFWGMKAA